MKHYIKNKIWNISEEYDINKVLYILIDRPDYVSSINNFIWHKNGNFHREYDLPYYIGCSGYLKWCENNNFHRENNKPTKIHSNGYKGY